MSIPLVFVRDRRRHYSNFVDASSKEVLVYYDLPIILFWGINELNMQREEIWLSLLLFTQSGKYIFYQVL